MSVPLVSSSSDRNARTGSAFDTRAGTPVRAAGQATLQPAESPTNLSSQAVELARLFDQATRLGTAGDALPSGSVTAGTGTGQPIVNNETTQALQKLASKSRSAGAGNKYAHIEDSGLPDDVQRLLKKIRDLKEQIREKKAEISKIQNDLNLDEKARTTKLAKAQAELGILIAALAKTADTLVQVTRQMKAEGMMSHDDVQMAGLLATI